MVTDKSLICDTHVSQNMVADSESGEPSMEKLNVRVPKPLLDVIDEEWERRGYASKSEAIRDALRDWVNPRLQLSDEALEALETSESQVSSGETLSAEDAREQLGLE